MLRRKRASTGIALGAILGCSLTYCHVPLARGSGSFGRLPLVFEAQEGQNGRFVSRGPGYCLLLSANEAVLALRLTGDRIPGLRHRDEERAVAGSAVLHRAQTATGSAFLRIKLIGGRQGLRGEGLEAMPTKVNYFIGNDPARWRRGVPTFGQVRYQEVYSGIDLIYYGNGGQLEFDFEVAAGADPAPIQLGVEGADQVELDANGDLVIRTAGATIHQRRPVAYQEVAGRRQPIAAGYTLSSGQLLNAKDRRWVVGFQIGSYDQTRRLVIDPVLIYSTYLGGTSLDRVLDLAVDANGSAYVTGETVSPNFPTANPLSESFNGGPHDVFVAKLSPAGTNLTFATYLGGNQDEIAWGIALGPGGDVYLTGATFSTNFPVTPNAVATNLHGSPYFGYFPYDAFVVRLDAHGTNLLYSTFLGGSGEENGLGIAVDEGGNAHVTGFTDSVDFPTNGVASSLAGGRYDAFFAKLTTTDNSLVYSAYLGGRGDDRGRAIAVDAAGGVVVAGVTGSIDFPLTNALQTNFLGGSHDAFVTRFSPDGTNRIFSTYLGGQATDVAARLALDGAGNTYIMGHTFSTNFPVRNAISSTNHGLGDLFVTKLDSTGTNLLYSTYLGGADVDEGWSIAVNADGSAHVVGSTFSTDFPAINALQSTAAGAADIVVLKLTPEGTALEFSTLLGGNNHEVGRGIGLDSEGNVYVAGQTASANFPALPSTNSPGSLYGGGQSDGFVTRIFPGAAVLRAERSGGDEVAVLWPKGLINYELQSIDALMATNLWFTVTNAPVVIGGDNRLTVPDPMGNSFFRLRRRD